MKLHRFLPLSVAALKARLRPAAKPKPRFNEIFAALRTLQDAGFTDETIMKAIRAPLCQHLAPRRADLETRHFHWHGDELVMPEAIALMIKYAKPRSPIA